MHSTYPNKLAGTMMAPLGLTCQRLSTPALLNVSQGGDLEAMLISLLTRLLVVV